MTSSTPELAGLPSIDRDRLQGFRRMADHVLDDMLEAALAAAGRHEHQVDLLKVRVAELEAENHRLTWVVLREARAAGEGALDLLNDATGGEDVDLVKAAENAASLIAALRHRIDEAQKQMSAAAEAVPQFLGLTVADLAEVLKEEAEGEDNAAVKKCLVVDDGDVSVVDTIRELCAQLRFLDDTVMNLAPTPAAKKRGAAQLAAVPPQKGPFVVTMKVPGARRFWGPGAQGEAVWVSDLAGAYQFADVASAERRKPRRSAVVTLADARELIEAEKVVSIAPPASPTGPEAA